jgi:SAM-dependent methyltransferase
MSRLIEILKRARGDALAWRIARDEEKRVRELLLMARAQKAALVEIKQQLARVEQVIGAQATSAKAPIVIPKIDEASWADVAQQGEMGFHKRPNMRSSDTWERDVERDWRELGFDSNGWEGKLIVDVGAGSRLRTLYFKGARLAALEPLGDRYIAEVAWQDIDKADELYSVPAEKLVPELEGRADLVVSINALDHGFDFATSIRNIRRYVKRDGVVFLSFDQHDRPDNMHPLALNDGIVRQIFQQAGFTVERSTPRRRYHGGVGPRALNYWLRPVDAEATAPT